MESGNTVYFDLKTSHYLRMEWNFQDIWKFSNFLSSVC